MEKTENVQKNTVENEVDGYNGTSEKMSIYDYEQKYVKRQNLHGAKVILRLLCASIGILIAACLISVTLRIWEFNMYAGIAAIVVSCLLFIIFYIVPLVKILRYPAFQTNVNAKTARAAQKHNRAVRHEVAEKIIDLTAKVEGAGWYDSAVVGAMAIALKTGDEESLMKAMTALYGDSVKKSAKDLIFRGALKSASYSALSQTSRVDALLVVFINLQLVKDLVFLYGFRPSDARLVKIFCRVLQNSLIAYGMGGIKIGQNVVKTMGDAVKGIPILGSAISTIVDSSVQGLTNGILTTVIGFQTIKYLSYEYKLQEILDGVKLADEEEVEEACAELERELKKNFKKRPAAQAV